VSESGVKGPLGWAADLFDRLPVGGPTILGTVVCACVVAGGTLVALLNGGTSQGDCAQTPLIHVYRPSRLHVLATCQQVTVTVVAWRHEHDGDYHVNVRADDPGWTNELNAERQHGLTVVEFVPGEPRPARFYGGQRLRLVGTRVEDLQHGRVIAGVKRGWVEMHPVFSFEDVTPAAVTPGPNAPRLAPRTESD
jgi:hypothetical protein